MEQQIVDAGAEIIWVLEANALFQPGTAQACRDFMDAQGSQLGWCVGDGETMPTAGTFDNSPFSQMRGFDIIVPRESMVIEFSTSHGTPGGNDNISGSDLLAQIEMIAETL
ncbi:hypothetical protein PPSIR1_24214 [Plesiocystis pacifica SIR-1]|uniref:Uncharacterized protein n=1 Tax=Plesiocystis pacifica SIR-1 TaxID=391625 RepID=A6GC07_9BACT|nr:hypothetical protein PPSIR1_24214 [Plesiocystis pacifica SIR-1]